MFEKRIGKSGRFFWYIFLFDISEGKFLHFRDLSNKEGKPKRTLVMFFVNWTSWITKKLYIAIIYFHWFTFPMNFLFRFITKNRITRNGTKKKKNVVYETRLSLFSHFLLIGFVRYVFYKVRGKKKRGRKKMMMWSLFWWVQAFRWANYLHWT